MSGDKPKVRDDAPPEPDEKAQAEASDISSKKYKREESRLTHVHWGGLVVFWFCILCALAITSVWLFNWLTPDSWHFLDPRQRSQLQNFMIAGVGSSVLSDYARNFLKR